MALPASTPTAADLQWSDHRRRAGGALDLIHTLVTAPFTRRQGRALLFCAAGVCLAMASPFAVFLLGMTLISTLTGSGLDPGALVVVSAMILVAALVAVAVVTGTARWIGRRQRTLAGRLLDVHVADPQPRRRSLGDVAGWRAVAYLTVRLPVALGQLYALFLAIGGLVNVSYPLVWGGFRNHPEGVRLSPLPVYTPLGMFGEGTFHVATLPGTFAAVAAGVAMLLAAPWVARVVTSVDAWLIRALLGPDRMAQRVRDLEQSRARAVDDSAALLRRLERDLHDGAQVRLATLAMHLGMAQQKLGDRGDVPDPTAARQLVDAALRGAKDALVELRSLARGIHPPALDNGLADALATLAADSSIPVDLQVEIPIRPTPAIETIAYFCAAELLANATKHSASHMITIRAGTARSTLALTVADDGVGGAVATSGTGLTGLAQRIAVVDGRLTIVSPTGGPTAITVELPLRP